MQVSYEPLQQDKTMEKKYIYIDIFQRIIHIYMIQRYIQYTLINEYNGPTEMIFP